jgi:hypothetical protein
MRNARITAILLMFIGSIIFANESSDKSPMSWEVLSKVKVVEKDNLLAPEFSEEVLSLNGKRVTLRGYMMPLDQAKKQKNFILSANPVAACYFCLPGGPETMVEVKALKSVPFNYNPIVVTGKLELLEDDPMGMYYRLVDAELVTE